MKKKILIVDDDGVIRGLYRSVINEYFDAIIVMGINGKDGWREFQESRPDLVISDLRMETPVAGLWLAKKIKEESPTTPVIIITGEGFKEVADVDCLLLKPFRTQGLVAVIEKFLRKEGKK